MIYYVLSETTCWLILAVAVANGDQVVQDVQAGQVQIQVDLVQWQGGGLARRDARSHCSSVQCI
jgi:hypothetical protein